MKDKAAGVEIEEFVGLKPKMYSFLVDDDSENEKAKGVNKIFIPAIGHNEYKYVLLINKCLRHSMNRIERKYNRIETYEITEFHCLALMTKYIPKTLDMMD